MDQQVFIIILILCENTDTTYIEESFDNKEIKDYLYTIKFTKLLWL